MRFFELWTLKEAYVKARGLGLAIPLRAFSFQRSPAGEWRIEFAAAIKDDPDGWRFRSWRVGVAHQVALAVSMD
jgi:4'-phosphopantetheinyl transferase